MTDNVIWGTDFKAKAPCTDDGGRAEFDAAWAKAAKCDIDTAPSEYTAPTDDCA